MRNFKPSAIAVEHDEQNTVFLVVMLILGVASIFVCFAMVAICYRLERMSQAGLGITGIGVVVVVIAKCHPLLCRYNGCCSCRVRAEMCGVLRSISLSL